MRKCFLNCYFWCIVILTLGNGSNFPFLSCCKIWKGWIILEIIALSHANSALQHYQRSLCPFILSKIINICLQSNCAFLIMRILRIWRWQNFSIVLGLLMIRSSYHPLLLILLNHLQNYLEWYLIWFWWIRRTF